MLCLANFVLSIMSIISYGRSVRSNPGIWKSVDWLTIVISLTLATNVTCTGLIAFRILRIHRRTAPLVVRVDGRHSGSITLTFLSVIVESAAIYTAMLVVTMILIRSQSFIFFIFIDCLPPTIGLVFSYIIIRVSRGTSYGDNGVESTNTVGHGQYRSNNRNFPSINTCSGGKTDIEVQIRMEQMTYMESVEIDGSSRDNESNVGKHAAA
ncbi:hypothetical protein MSAN_00813900 [Mycena sanguinolenta]|uniref:Uncharacterized protein n=1 Tax=Mycena sanguinolenta TaxID=230812 RepID=A0A8H7D9R5_9AGAR|nr:hypothetical protein MSAN_00813900 [Mycena sanguinolenta]